MNKKLRFLQRKKHTPPPVPQAPWYNKLTLDLEYFEENQPWDLQKVKDMFESLYPQYTIKQFIVNDSDPESIEGKKIQMFLFFNNTGFVNIKIQNKTKFKEGKGLDSLLDGSEKDESYWEQVCDNIDHEPQEQEIAKAIQNHISLNPQLKTATQIRMIYGWDGDDFIQDRTTIRISYKFD